MELIRWNYPATKQIFTASQTRIKCLSMEAVLRAEKGPRESIKDCKAKLENNSEPE